MKVITNFNNYISFLKLPYIELKKRDIDFLFINKYSVSIRSFYNIFNLLIKKENPNLSKREIFLYYITALAETMHENKYKIDILKKDLPDKVLYDKILLNIHLIKNISSLIANKNNIIILTIVELFSKIEFLSIFSETMVNIINNYDLDLNNIKSCYINNTYDLDAEPSEIVTDTIQMFNDISKTRLIPDTDRLNRVNELK